MRAGDGVAELTDTGKEIEGRLRVMTCSDGRRYRNQRLDMHVSRISIFAMALLALLVGMLSWGTTPALADSELSTRLSVSVERNADDELRPRVNVTLTDAEGNAVRDRRAESSQGRVTLHNAGRSTSTVYLAGQTTASTTTTRLASGSTYDVYANYAGGSYDGTSYLESESDHVTVSVVAATLPTAVATSADAGSSNGSIALSGGSSYQYTKSDPDYAADWQDVDGSALTDLAPGTYYVRSGSSFSSSNGRVTIRLASEAVQVQIGENQPVYHTVTLGSAEHALWSGNGSLSTISVRDGSGTASPYVKAEEGFRISGIEVSPAGAATVEFRSTGEVFC